MLTQTWEVLGSVGRCWEVLGSVGKCWEVLGSVGKLVCGYTLVHFFLSSLILSASADTNMGSDGK